MNAETARLRDPFRCFMTGAAVATTRDAAKAPIGFTARSFTSVSPDPPPPAVRPGAHLPSFETVAAAPRLAISILSKGREAISTRLAGLPGDRFSGCGWTAAQDDIPLITGHAAGSICETRQRIPAGDHLVLIGRVARFDSADRGRLGHGPEGYFPSAARAAEGEAAPLRATRVRARLDERARVFLAPDHELPGVDAGPGQSPLRALGAHLRRIGIAAEPTVLHAACDDGAKGGRIVFRRHSASAPPGLSAAPIAAPDEPDAPAPALCAPLARFGREHATRSFGFRIGGDRDGEAPPAFRDQNHGFLAVRPYGASFRRPAPRRALRRFHHALQNGR